MLTTETIGLPSSFCYHRGSPFENQILLTLTDGASRSDANPMTQFVARESWRSLAENPIAMSPRWNKTASDFLRDQSIGLDTTGDTDDVASSTGMTLEPLSRQSSVTSLLSRQDSMASLFDSVPSSPSVQRRFVPITPSAHKQRPPLALEDPIWEDPKKEIDEQNEAGGPPAAPELDIARDANHDMQGALKTPRPDDEQGTHVPSTPEAGSDTQDDASHEQLTLRSPVTYVRPLTDAEIFTPPLQSPAKQDHTPPGGPAGLDTLPDLSLTLPMMHNPVQRAEQASPNFLLGIPAASSSSGHSGKFGFFAEESPSSMTRTSHAPEKKMHGSRVARLHSLVAAKTQSEFYSPASQKRSRPAKFNPTSLVLKQSEAQACSPHSGFPLYG